MGTGLVRRKFHYLLERLPENGYLLCKDLWPMEMPKAAEKAAGPVRGYCFFSGFSC